MPTPAPTPDQYLSSFPPLTQTLAHRTRALVRRVLPAATEQVRLGWQLIGFYVPGHPRPVYTGFIIPHIDYVTLGFEYGILLNLARSKPEPPRYSVAHPVGVRSRNVKSESAVRPTGIAVVTASSEMPGVAATVSIAWVVAEAISAAC